MKILGSLVFFVAAAFAKVETRLIIEGSEASERTFVVLHYVDGVGIRYYECDKPEGELARLVKDGKFNLEEMKCNALQEHALSSEQVRDIRNRANDGSLFDRYASKEKRFGCAALAGGVGMAIGSYLLPLLYAKMTPQERCITVVGDMATTVQTVRTRPNWWEAFQEAREMGPRLRPPMNITAATLTLLGAVFCMDGYYRKQRVEEKWEDRRWIFAHDPQLNSEGGPAPPLETYQAKRLTIAEIKQTLLAP